MSPLRTHQTQLFDPPYEPRSQPENIYDRVMVLRGEIIVFRFVLHIKNAPIYAPYLLGPVGTRWAFSHEAAQAAATHTETGLVVTQGHSRQNGLVGLADWVGWLDIM